MTTGGLSDLLEVLEKFDKIELSIHPIAKMYEGTIKLNKAGSTVTIHRNSLEEVIGTMLIYAK